MTCRISLLSLLACNLVAADKASLFNGRDLDNWQIIGKAQWKVVEGEIHGGQFGNPKHGGILATRDSYKDFELDLEFKIDEHGKYNSGVYIRRQKERTEGPPYQINIGRGVAGEPVGLHRVEWLEKGDKKDHIRRPRNWNHLRIRAVGPHIQVWLNEKQIVDYTEKKPEPYLLKAGAIAFQTYGAEGHDGWVHFRKIHIARLTSR
ncbi:MAG: DUF1080 domain-containing protein [Opitutae bacterium]|nr:DUF1080 domain-containing protein [Opitutae bacterium]